jgi:hypothetical protein
MVLLALILWCSARSAHTKPKPPKFIGSLEGLGAVSNTEVVMSFDATTGRLLPGRRTVKRKNDLVVHIEANRIWFQRGENRVSGKVLHSTRADGTRWIFFSLVGDAVRVADRKKLLPGVTGPGYYDGKNFIKGMIVVERDGRAKLTGKAYLGGTRRDGDGAWRTTTFSAGFRARP